MKICDNKNRYFGVLFSFLFIFLAQISGQCFAVEPTLKVYNNTDYDIKIDGLEPYNGQLKHEGELKKYDSSRLTRIEPSKRAMMPISPWWSGKNVASGDFDFKMYPVYKAKIHVMKKGSNVDLGGTTLIIKNHESNQSFTADGGNVFTITVSPENWRHPVGDTTGVRYPDYAVTVE